MKRKHTLRKSDGVVRRACVQTRDVALRVRVLPLTVATRAQGIPKCDVVQVIVVDARAKELGLDVVIWSCE